MKRCIIPSVTDFSIIGISLCMLRCAGWSAFRDTSWLDGTQACAAIPSISHDLRRVKQGPTQYKPALPAAQTNPIPITIRAQISD
jgi:hypothetical protein